MHREINLFLPGLDIYEQDYPFFSSLTHRHEFWITVPVVLLLFHWSFYTNEKDRLFITPSSHNEMCPQKAENNNKMIYEHLFFLKDKN